jgi:hypothetical protein
MERSFQIPNFPNCLLVKNLRDTLFKMWPTSPRII